MKNITKKYTTNELTVVWKPELCTHSAKCFHGLPRVFAPREKPWIKPEQTTSMELMKQIDLCPSGALSYINHQQAIKSNTMETNSIKIQVTAGGPLLVNGTCTIVDKDGNGTIKEGMTALCRCGHSSNKPYCDGAHRTNNFEII